MTDINENNSLEKSILENHITAYIKSVSKVLVVAYLVIFIAEIIVGLFVKFGFFTYHLKNKFGENINYISFVKEQLLHEAYIWITFGIYFLLQKKANFSRKKTLLCALTLITTTLLSFGHWKNNFFSILYVIPVIITIPLDKTRNKIVVIISFIMVILYAFYHNIIDKNEVHFLIAACSLLTIVTCYLISIKLHNTLNNAFMDIKKYAEAQKVLTDQLAHDTLTNAYSKTALEQELQNITNFNSMAFLDIDDFKDVNDKNGHQTGDYILKLLVTCINTKKLQTYRYGGDEFVVLSELQKSDLGNSLKRIKNTFNYSGKELYDTTVTISVGVIAINKEKSGEENLSYCDEFMYKAKKSGKDKVFIE